MKKAQVKFGETIGILFIVYLILMVGLTWYNSINEDDIKELIEEQNEVKANQMYEFVLNSNFIRKSQGSESENLMDMYSLQAFYDYSQSLEGEDFLRKRLGEGIIKIYFYQLDHTNDDDLIIYDLDTTNPPGKQDDAIILYNFTRIGEEPKNFNIIRSTYPVEETLSGEIFIGVLEVNSYVYD